MKKAVFLDRDGVINFERGEYTKNIDEFIINKSIIDSVKLLRDNDFLVIVITNQGGIAKALYTEEDVMEMHIKLCEELAKVGTNINDIFYCPHHDSISKCLCRKPDSLLLEKAIAYYNIDVKKSYMIGDSDRDIVAAEKVGVRGFKIKANESIYNYCKEIVDNNV